MKNLITLLLIAISFCSIAQEAKVEEELKVHLINGKEYYIHLVEQGNTLYAISRKYAIPVEELQKENPRLTQELTIGDRLLIPIKEIKRKDLNESMEIDGNFLVHEVQKKNTLYSIAKDYNVTVEDIVAENPLLTEGLKKGAKIRIPIAKIKDDKNQSEYITPAISSPYVTHLVLPKETLYSLSKQYNISTDSILDVNNGLPGGLRQDQLINIPILKTYEDTTVKPIKFDSSRVKKVYKVALLAPFYLEMMKQLEDTTYKASSKLQEELHLKAKYAILFYQGFKMAADSLSKKGLNVQLHIFDSGNNLEMVNRVLKSDTLKKMDLIVGPFYLDVFQKVADYAKKNKIHIVSPVKLSNKILLGNSFVSKVATSESTLDKYMAKFAFERYRDSSLIMVYPDNLEERDRAESIKREFYRLNADIQDTSQKSILKEAYWNVNEFSALKQKFSLTEMNYIIVPSNDQAFVTRLLTMLNMANTYRFTIIGLAQWDQFDNIEVNYLENLNVQLIVPEFINLKDPYIINFERNYSQRYSIFPEQFSYLGFEVGYYFMSILKEFGANFSATYPNFELQVLSRNFSFSKTGIESGFENNSHFVITYENFSKQVVK